MYYLKLGSFPITAHRSSLSLKKLPVPWAGIRAQKPKNYHCISLCICSVSDNSCSPKLTDIRHAYCLPRCISLPLPNYLVSFEFK